MGAWGPGAFENDGALDWVAELQDARDWTPVQEALEATAGSAQYVDGDDPEASVAAAAVVALALDRQLAKGVELPDEVEPYLGGVGVPPATLVALAAASLDLVLAPQGDLRARWQGAPADRWEADVRRWQTALRR